MSSKKRTVLALDISTSAGRAVLVHYENESLKAEEIYRFINKPVFCQKHAYWNILGLFQEIKNSLRKAVQYGGFDSVGIDAWGADYALIDQRGELLGNPVRTRNTISKLSEQQQHAPELLSQTQAFLLMPDLFAYLLTGDISTELSIAGTTQLCNAFFGGWDGKAVKSFGLPEHIFPAMAQTGTVKGMLSDEICEELEIASVPVIAVCGHDLQCAVTAVPAIDRKSFAFLSSGTERGLLGTELKFPVTSSKIQTLGIFNTIGFENMVLFQKSITGTEILHKIQNLLAKQGRDCHFSDLEKLALSAESCQRFIDVDAPAFANSDDMLVKIRDWCSESGQPAPADIGDILRCVYESLACRFRDTLDEIQNCSGQKFEKLYLLGGCVRDRLLCQLTANACQIPVCTGSAESSAYGNAVIQLIRSGIVPDLFEARWLIAKAIESKTFQPETSDMYECYQKIFKS